MILFKMFRELFLKKKVKSSFTKNAIHIMIKFHKNQSSLPSLGSYFIIFEKINNYLKNIWFRFFF
jgi:hypothetical protein